MVQFKNYTEIKLLPLHKELEKAQKMVGIEKAELAKALNVNAQTIENAFILYTPKKSQDKTFKASDRIVCQVAKALGINLAIVETGEKRYYVKGK